MGTHLPGLPAQVGHLETVERPAQEVWSVSRGMVGGGEWEDSWVAEDYRDVWWGWGRLMIS